MITQTDFGTAIAQTIGAEIKRHRKARRWSALRLADECGKAGMNTITRSLISDLENRRRNSVNVAELLVLASALGVPPVLLLCPVGHHEAVEILPGTEVAAFSAAQWISGEAPLAVQGDDEYVRDIAADWNHATGNPLAIYRKYDTAAREETDALRRARQMEERAATGDAVQREAYAAAAAALREKAEGHRAERENVRREAERLGLLPPGETGTGED